MLSSRVVLFNDFDTKLGLHKIIYINWYNKDLHDYTLTIPAIPAAASLAALMETAVQTCFNISISDSDAFTLISFMTWSILYLSWLLKKMLRKHEWESVWVFLWKKNWWSLVECNQMVTSKIGNNFTSLPFDDTY